MKRDEKTLAVPRLSANPPSRRVEMNLPLDLIEYIIYWLFVIERERCDGTTALADASEHCDFDDGCGGWDDLGEYARCS